MKNYFSIVRNILSDEVERHFLLDRNGGSPVAGQEARYWKCYKYYSRQFSGLLSGISEPTYSLTHPKVIWWCWLQGEEAAPALCKMCLESLRAHFPDYEIRVVTSENLHNWITLPEYILSKHNQGIIPHAHFSDIVRTALLVQHGGSWIDSSVYCTAPAVSHLEAPLFLYQNWKFNEDYAFVASSWFISASANHPILSATLQLLYTYWENRDVLIDYYLFHVLFHIAKDQYPKEWNAMPRYSNIPPHILQFELFQPYDSTRYSEICRMSDFHKLTWKAPQLQGDIGGTLYEHLLSKYSVKW